MDKLIILFVVMAYIVYQVRSSVHLHKAIKENIHLKEKKLEMMSYQASAASYIAQRNLKVGLYEMKKRLKIHLISQGIMIVIFMVCLGIVIYDLYLK